MVVRGRRWDWCWTIEAAALKGHASKQHDPCTSTRLPTPLGVFPLQSTLDHTHGLRMVYYIRLLKPPRISTGKTRKASVKFVITITTDLGDTFFPEDVELTSYLIDSKNTAKVLASTNIQWRNGIRSVNADIDVVNHPDINWPIRLYIHAKGVTQSLGLDPGDIPIIVQVYSDDIDLGNNREARRRVERVFGTYGPYLEIWEETGESIARHVW